MKKPPISTTDVRIGRRRILAFLGLIISIGFGLNVLWEMGQMAAYVETADQPWYETLALCTRAAAGDVVILLGIYCATALAAADSVWSLRGKWNHYAIAMVLGIGTAALIEHAALADGRWTYNKAMPLVPFLEAGLWPLLQMVILPPLTFLMAVRLSSRRWAGKRGFLD